jgi:hypothetical protein
MRLGTVRSKKLPAATAGITLRSSPPPIRKDSWLRTRGVAMRGRHCIPIQVQALGADRPEHWALAVIGFGQDNRLRPSMQRRRKL